jgi:hypothetical protein
MSLGSATMLGSFVAAQCTKSSLVFEQLIGTISAERHRQQIERPQLPQNVRTRLVVTIGPSNATYISVKGTISGQFKVTFLARALRMHSTATDLNLMMEGEWGVVGGPTHRIASSLCIVLSPPAVPGQSESIKGRPGHQELKWR